MAEIGQPLMGFQVLGIRCQEESVDLCRRVLVREAAEWQEQNGTEHHHEDEAVEKPHPSDQRSLLP